MRDVIVEDPETILYLKDVPQDNPVFVYQHDNLIGMIVKEDRGWVCRLGGDRGYTGFFPKRSECVWSVINDGCTVKTP